ncbi:MAG: NUDIX hydrolase YfcD [Arenicellales bacterium]|nr:NUDIX hydrolase YfcD [Arenicellales bacterium]
MGAANEIVSIVDESDNIVGQEPRHVMRAQGLLHRVTYIFVFNTNGELLVQKRTYDKDLYPGYYDLAAGGVVCVGESYEQSALREAREELGIENTPLEFHFKFFFNQEGNRCWGKVFSCVHDGPFILQEEEVESGEFMSIDRITDGDIGPITPDTRAVFERYIKDTKIKL